MVPNTHRKCHEKWVFNILYHILWNVTHEDKFLKFIIIVKYRKRLCIGLKDTAYQWKIDGFIHWNVGFKEIDFTLFQIGAPISPASSPNSPKESKSFLYWQG